MSVITIPKSLTLILPHMSENNDELATFGPQLFSQGLGPKLQLIQDFEDMTSNQCHYYT